jgi:hypothetical protein
VLCCAVLCCAVLCCVVLGCKCVCAAWVEHERAAVWCQCLTAAEAFHCVLHIEGRVEPQQESNTALLLTVCSCCCCAGKATAASTCLSRCPLLAAGPAGGCRWWTAHPSSRGSPTGGARCCSTKGTIVVTITWLIHTQSQRAHRACSPNGLECVKVPRQAA